MKPTAQLLSADGNLYEVKVSFVTYDGSDPCGLALDIGQAALQAVLGGCEQERRGEDMPPIEQGENARASVHESSAPEQSGKCGRAEAETGAAHPPPGSKPKALPKVGDIFEGQEVKVAKAVEDEWRIKLADGTLIAFDRLSHEEKRRKVPEPPPSEPPKKEENYLFAAVDNLTDLVGECYAECGGDKVKATEMLESLSASHPVLKAAAPSWRDRAQRRMLVLDARQHFPEKHE